MKSLATLMTAIVLTMLFVSAYAEAPLQQRTQQAQAENQRQQQTVQQPQAGVAAQDRVRDQDRLRNRDQLRTHSQIYAGQLMSAQERAQYRDQLQTCVSEEECNAYVVKHFETLLERARQRDNAN